MKKNRALFTLIMFAAFFTFYSCKKENTKIKTGFLAFYFGHNVNGLNLIFDTVAYVNEAGNPYMVNEIQYFISDVIIYSNGKQQLLDAYNDIHYVDSDLPETWNYTLPDSVPVGNYDSISFIFGISEEKNKSLIFVNPPESNMFWPEYLGGGYHYMKLNGKWKNTEGTIMPFNFHLGIGQIYDPNTNEITGFVQNYFRVYLSNSAFTVTENEMVYFDLTMNVEEWFKNPNTFDFNYWGGHIMQNQAAMALISENGQNAFSISRMIIDK